jgi:hypothetical protein
VQSRRAVVVSSLVLAALAACAQQAKPEGAADSAAEASAAPAAITSAVADAAPAPVDKGKPTKIAVVAGQTSVVDHMAWSEGGGAHRLGYLRLGAQLDAYDKPVANDDCNDGWYELVEGNAYVCGKAVTTNLSDPRVRLAPKQPDRDAGLPYKYGINLVAGTPLYRKVLSLEDRKKFEPELAPKPAEETETSAAEKEESPPAGSDETSDKPEKSGSPLPAPLKGKEKDAGSDAGKPRLKDLRGKGVLVRKMQRGFFLALDREFKGAGSRWWRTTFGFAVPHDRIMLQTAVTKHVGAWWMEPVETEGDPDAGAHPGAVGFVNNRYTHKILLGDDGKTKWGDELTKRSAVMLTGKMQTVSGVTYHEAVGGFWVRPMDLDFAHPAIPADVGEKEKWIDVDLTRQALVAFEGTRPVFATLISSGRRNPQDKDHDFPTPTGTFHIREKHVTATMDGDHAVDGPYSIEDVPWVMYFQGSYALHGAFWHDGFGSMRSHGCVNLAPEDARTLFAWSDPQLPPNWHGVTSKSEADGTRIVIHEDQPQKKH